ncbi:MAG: hypothetical protein ACTSRG_22685 [Candidatus Helarchaeota archaeon]
MNKAIVLNFLCVNVDCNFSQEKLQIKQTLNIVESSGNCSFKIPTCCPRCKSPVELVNFVSGSVEIEADKIE